jgi:hypothetical protein
MPTCAKSAATSQPAHRDGVDHSTSVERVPDLGPLPPDGRQRVQPLSIHH